jgi:hypothetical protein
LDKVNWYWVVAFVLNDIAIFYTGYLFWKKANFEHFYGQDTKILHCQKCGRPEVVPYFASEMKDCAYCSGYWCEECETTHFAKDEGYELKNKKNSKKKKVEETDTAGFQLH